MGSIRQFVGRSSLGARRVVRLISCGERHDWASRNSIDLPRHELSTLLLDALDTVLITRNEMAATFVAKELSNLPSGEKAVVDKLAQVIAEVDPVAGRAVLQPILAAVAELQGPTHIHHDDTFFPMLLAAVQSLLQKPAMAFDREIERHAINLLSKWSADPVLGQKMFLAVAVSNQLANTSRCIWLRLLSHDKQIRTQVRTIFTVLLEHANTRRLSTSSLSSEEDLDEEDSIAVAFHSPASRPDGLQMIAAALKLEMQNERSQREIRIESLGSESVVEATPSPATTQAVPIPNNLQFLAFIRDAILNYANDWPRAEEALSLWRLLADYCLQDLRASKQSADLVNEFVALPDPLLDSQDNRVLDALFDHWKSAAIRSSANRIQRSTNAKMHVVSLLAPLVDRIKKGHTELRPSMIECWRDLVRVAATSRSGKSAPPLIDSWTECFEPVIACMASPANQEFSRLVVSMYRQAFSNFAHPQNGVETADIPDSPIAVNFNPEHLSNLPQWLQKRVEEACDIVRLAILSGPESPVARAAVVLFGDVCRATLGGNFETLGNEWVRNQLQTIYRLLSTISLASAPFLTKRDLMAVFLANCPPAMLRSEEYGVDVPFFFASLNQSSDLANSPNSSPERMHPPSPSAPILNFIDMWIKTMATTISADTAAGEDEEVAIQAFDTAVKVICEPSRSDFKKCFQDLLQVSIFLDEAWRKQDTSTTNMSTRLVLKLWARLASELTQILERDDAIQNGYTGLSSPLHDIHGGTSVAVGMLTFPIRVMLFSTRSASQTVQLSPSSYRRPPGVVVAEWSCLYTTLANKMNDEQSVVRLADSMCEEIYTMSEAMFRSNAPAVPPLLFEFVLCCTGAVLGTVGSIANDDTETGTKGCLQKGVQLVTDAVHVGIAILSRCSDEKEANKQDHRGTIMDAQRASRIALDALSSLAKKLPRAEDISLLAFASYAALERYLATEYCETHVVRVYQSIIESLKKKMSGCSDLPGVLGPLEPVLRSMMRSTASNVPVWAAYFVREVEQSHMANWPEMQKLAVNILQVKNRRQPLSRVVLSRENVGAALKDSISPNSKPRSRGSGVSQKGSLRDRLAQEHRAKESRVHSSRTQRLLASLDVNAVCPGLKDPGDDSGAFAKYRQLSGGSPKHCAASQASLTEGRDESPLRNRITEEPEKLNGTPLTNETPLAGILRKRKDVEHCDVSLSPSPTTGKRVKFAAADDLSTSEQSNLAGSASRSPAVAKALFSEPCTSTGKDALNTLLENLKSDVDGFVTDPSTSSETLVALYKSLRSQADEVFDSYHQRVSDVRAKISSVALEKPE